MSAEGDAAGREAGGTPSTLDFEGLGFTLELPPKLPFRVLRAIGKNAGSEAGQAVAVLEEILGVEQADKVWDADLDIDAGRELVEKILGEYGVNSGESAASPSS